MDNDARSEDAILEEMAEDVLDHVKEPGKTWKKRGGIALLLVAIAAGFMFWKSSNSDAPTTEYVTHAVERGDVVATVIATGNLEPEATVTVGAEISGKIEVVLVDNNDEVKKDQPLAVFDTESLRNSLAQSEAALKTARAQVRRARATLDEAKLEYRRIEPLVKKKVVASSQLDQARATVARAEAALASARAELERGQRTVDLTKTNLDKGEILSPIDGIVLKRSIEPGNVVAASLQAPELFILAPDLKAMELHVAVDEADIGQLKEGQSASFTVDAWPDRAFDARVTEVSLYATTSDNVVTYDTVLGVDNAEGLLRPGMTATAAIVTDRAENVLKVPNSALRFKPQTNDASRGLFGPPGRRQSQSKTHKRDTVWVLEGGAPVEKTFKPGRTDGRFTEVQGDSLSEGALVITSSRPIDGSAQ